MTLEELHSRYGSHIARRVQAELRPAEFEQREIEGLPSWLEQRAERAHKEYQARLENPFAAGRRTGQMDNLYRRWREAEDLAYLVSVSEEAAHISAAVGGRK